MENKLTQLIKEKYLLPTRGNKNKTIGIEIEMPIVNLEKKAVNYEMIHQLTEKFVKHFSFEIIERDEENHIYFATSKETLDGISFDCSYNTLEISFGPEKEIIIIEDRFRSYVEYLQEHLKKYHHILTGMGINPNYKLNEDRPIPNERYRMLYHHLSSYPKYEKEKSFHAYPNFGFFSCSSQVQLDVEEKNLTTVINLFSKLEPVKAILFANSLWQENETLLCARDMFWKESLHGINTHNVDMYEIELQTTEEIIEYIKSMSIYCVIRDGKYIHFKPMSIRRFFQDKQIEGEYFNGQEYQKVVFSPEWKDIDYLRSFKFEDLTYRGTIEFRSSCTQPLADSMAIAAFHVGLIEDLDGLGKLLENDTVLYGHGYSPTELRQLLCKKELPEFLDKEELSNLLVEILDISKEALVKRGYGEERYLKSLYLRARQLENPALKMLRGIQSGKNMDYYIQEYAKL